MVLEERNHDENRRAHTRDGSSSPASTMEAFEADQNLSNRNLSKTSENGLGDSLNERYRKGVALPSGPPAMPDFHSGDAQSMSGNSRLKDHETSSIDKKIPDEDKTLSLLRNIVKGAEEPNCYHDIDIEDTANKDQNDPQHCDANSKCPEDAQHSRLLSSRNFQYSVAGRCFSAISYNVTHSRWGRRVFRRQAGPVPDLITVENIPGDTDDRGEASSFCSPDSPSFASDDDLFQGFVLRNEAENNGSDGTIMNANHLLSETSHEGAKRSEAPTSEIATTCGQREATESSRSALEDNNHFEEDVGDWCGHEERIQATVRDLQAHNKGVFYSETIQCVTPLY